MASDKKLGRPRFALTARDASAGPAPRASRARGHLAGTAGTAGTAEYYSRIQKYAHAIRQTQDIGDIIAILDEALGQTRALHKDNEVASARAQVAAAEQQIEKLRSELELMSRLVREDQLTGALNRRGLDEALAREVARAERAGASLCVAMIDIDDFKNINDSFGHQVGDIVLVHLVSLIRETIRNNDLIGRYGGDEFLLLLPELQMEEASAVMDRLRREVAAKPLSWGNHRLVVSFSIGVAARVSGEEGFALVQRADQALYAVKRVGKDRIALAS